MECNKDEATRAKQIAEKKFLAKDISGAKKFALKAERLFPELEGISQMLATFDVYLYGESKGNGEADWYSILRVSPQADDESVRKQYRKLALMLHPDKNKSLGAEGAFKIVSEAWSVLSDKTRRAAYDQKRFSKPFRKVTPGGSSSKPPGANGFYDFTKTSSSSVRTPKSASQAGQPPNATSSQKAKSDTFWTVCHRCRMQYEYLRRYHKHNLKCPNCQQAFVAVEIAPPPPTKKTYLWNEQKHQKSNNQTGSKSSSNSGRTNGTSDVRDAYNRTNFQWGPFSKNGTAPSAAQAACVVQQAYERVKKERKEAQAARKSEEALHRKHHASKRTSFASSSGNPAKKRRGMEYFVGLSSHGNNVSNINQTGDGSVGTSTGISSGLKHGGNEPGVVSGLTNPHRAQIIVPLRNLLMEKAKKEILKKIQVPKSATGAPTASEEKKTPHENIERQSSNISSFKDKYEVCHQGISCHSKDGKKEILDVKPRLDASRVYKESDISETRSITVPDSDFHNFDNARTESSFKKNQVWALYDDDIGMPRYYAMIHKVISLNPFRIIISWLHPEPDIELGSLSLGASDFRRACGDFRVGKFEMYTSVNAFSHQARWGKGTGGLIHIYPKRGDVWAIYRNWTIEWNELTTDEVIHAYDMVEVLEDYHEELGVTVIPLVKVAGFKTIYHPHLDHREVRRISREQILCFSHFVPSHILTGLEAPSSLKNCRELDPAAMPLNLLHVIPEIKEEDFLEEQEMVEEVTSLGNDDDSITVSNNVTVRQEEENLNDLEGLKVVKDTTETKKDEKLVYVEEKSVY